MSHRLSQLPVAPDRRTWPRWLGAVLCLLAVLAAPRAVQAQTASSATERQQLYEELAQEVAALERQGNLLKRVVRLVKPTVVHIEARKPGMGGRRSVEEAGSGVIIEHDGAFYVLTNRHVIREAPVEQIRVTLDDGRLLRPLQKWSDQGTDVAIISLAETDLVPARLGDSNQVEIGDFVLAVGSPFGLSHSVTFGIISATGRHDLKLGVEGVQYQNFFQTDAAINPGNSGGPLLNLRGEVVGINTAIASNSGGNEGIGFSIPVNLAYDVATQLVERGNVTRAFLGVLLDSSYDEDAAAAIGLSGRLGARVKGVTAGSAAEAAALEVGDIIVQYDGVTIENDSHLINQVKVTPVGKEVTISVLREGRLVTLSARVGSGEE